VPKQVRSHHPSKPGGVLSSQAVSAQLVVTRIHCLRMMRTLLTVLTVFSSVLRMLMILLPARPPERDLQASAHAALRRARGFGKSVRSSAFILLNAIIDNPHMRAVAQIEQPAYRVLGHAKLFGELNLRPSSRAPSRRARNW
jgi:hypothetical protein